jgi:adenosine/AMP kinase
MDDCIRIPTRMYNLKDEQEKWNSKSSTGEEGSFYRLVVDLNQVQVIFQEGVEQMNVKEVRIVKPDAVNFILGQTHFIKSVEDIHEALVNSVPGIRFGLAFCEASGDCLIRWSGTDAAMIELAKQNMLTIGAGHSFIIFLAEGFYPINVLNAVKAVPEVCSIFCATANPALVVIGDPLEMNMGRAILGVVDGYKPKGIEGEDGISWRKSFLRAIGYKAG